MEINKARAKMREKVSPTETSKTTEASGIRKIQQLKESVAGSQKNVPKWFQNFTGHDLKCLTSFQNFVDLMHRPTDSSSLGVGRALFGNFYNFQKFQGFALMHFLGLMMLIDIPEERSGGDLDLRWGEPRDCRFPLFPFLSPLTLPKMGIVYLIMWMGKKYILKILLQRNSFKYIFNPKPFSGKVFFSMISLSFELFSIKLLEFSQIK